MHLIVRGRVQGVCYRMYACEKAEELGITGWVCNSDDGSVEIIAEGNESGLAQFLAWCRRGPPYSRVTDVLQEYSDSKDEYSGFLIKH